MKLINILTFLVYTTCAYALSLTKVSNYNISTTTSPPYAVYTPDEYAFTVSCINCYPL
jgi:hypothetical protein